MQGSHNRRSAAHGWHDEFGNKNVRLSRSQEKPEAARPKANLTSRGKKGSP
jgi:hypothetical protein